MLWRRRAYDNDLNDFLFRMDICLPHENIITLVCIEKRGGNGINYAEGKPPRAGMWRNKVNKFMPWAVELLLCVCVLMHMTLMSRLQIDHSDITAEASHACTFTHVCLACLSNITTICLYNNSQRHGTNVTIHKRTDRWGRKALLTHPHAVLLSVLNTAHDFIMCTQTPVMESWDQRDITADDNLIKSSDKHIQMKQTSEADSDIAAFAFLLNLFASD